MHEVRGDGLQREALAGRLTHEQEVSVFQVAYASVHDLRRPARRAEGEVVLFDEGDRPPSQGGIAGDSGTGNSSSDHEEVHGLRGHRLEGRGPAGR